MRQAIPVLMRSPSAMQLHFLVVAAIASCIAVDAACLGPNPAFPIPQWNKQKYSLDEKALDTLKHDLTELLSDGRWNTTSVSAEITSTTDTLWTWYHSPRKVNETRPGVRQINGESQYRVGSVSKTFTVLALLYEHDAGNLHLDDPVNKYIPEFAADDAGKLPWKDITLRALASQLSGLPREFALIDILTRPDDPTSFGLPPASRDALTPCLRDTSKVCSREELIEDVKRMEPLFAPNQKSTYSNLNYEILGIVIENVTGKTFEEYMHEKIFKPLNMSSSSLSTPSDEHAVLPLGTHWWDLDLGVLNPTGGMYSTSSDLSKYLRYILTHSNSLATGINWFNPASFGSGPASYYGMPWEIFRTSHVLKSNSRAVTLVNKAGAVPGHESMITVLPDYNLAFTVLVAGGVEVLLDVLELVTVALVHAAEDAAWKHVESIYPGTFKATDTSLNSSISIGSSPAHGIVLEHFISNSTDALHAWGTELDPNKPKESWRAQLVPTTLYKDEKKQDGEIFRVAIVKNALPDDGDRIWSRECHTDLDVPGNYAKLPVNEFVYWHRNDSWHLPAWKVTLKREKEALSSSGRKMQKLLTSWFDKMLDL